MARLHDLGGVRGFGTIPTGRSSVGPKPEWANEVGALELALRLEGHHTLHHFRAARELLDAHLVMNSSYHGLRLWATEVLLRERPPEGVPAVPDRLIETFDDAFSVGDRLRVRTDNPTGHSRVPNYLRGRVGVIERVGSTKAYPPDIVADAEHIRVSPVYTVLFASSEVWGSAGTDDFAVSADLWSFDVRPL